MLTRGILEGVSGSHAHPNEVRRRLVVLTSGVLFLRELTRTGALRSGLSVRSVQFLRIELPYAREC